MGAMTATVLATTTSTADCLGQNGCQMTVRGLNKPDVYLSQCSKKWTRHSKFNYIQIATDLTSSTDILQSEEKLDSRITRIVQLLHLN